MGNLIISKMGKIMKKIIKMFSALTLIMSMGCVNDLNDEVVNPSGQTIVKIGLEKTKTHLGELVDGSRKIYWSDGDQISINGVSSSEIRISDENTYADFLFDAVLDYPYCVLYPAADYENEATVKLPAIQASATASFAANSAPMAGYADGEGVVSLKHLAAVVRLQVKLPAESEHNDCVISKVEFRGNSGEQVSGAFTIDYAAATLTSASTAESDKVVATMVDQKLTTEVTEVFVVVPAQEYKDGFSVRLIDNSGHFMDMSSKPCTLQEGDIKPMPVFEYAPTGTLEGVVIISSAADLVKFAADYNADEYKEVADLKVMLTSDIVFDNETSAAWEPIGTSSNWFKGTFDGSNYSIKNWVASRPLFHATAGTAKIQNLVIDSSCKLTANFDDAVTHFGGFVGSHRGVLYNCHNNADVAVTGTWEGDANVGGLVGICVNSAKVEDCSMSGDILADENFAVSEKMYLAGVVGKVDYLDAKILDTDFKGNFTINGGGTADAPSAYVGGIAGLSKGTIAGCTTAKGKTILGENKNNKVYYFYFGGLVGRAESGSIENCKNNSYVHLKYPRVSGNNNASYIAGVAGAIVKGVSLKDCENANTVQSSSDSRYVYLAGVVGHVEAEAVVENCHNRAAGKVITSDYGSGSNGALYLYMGGVVGRCYSSGVTNVSNAGNIEMNCVQNHNSTSVNVGGCIGFLDTSLDGKNAITNSGNVTAADAAASRAYLALGGVVGTSYGVDATIANMSNTGDVTDAVTAVHKHAFSGGVVGLVRNAVTVENVTNRGKVHFSNANKQIHVNVGLGGIIGGVSALEGNDFAVTVRESQNFGEVSRVATAEAVQKSSAVCGGIVGILKGTGSSVVDCDNSGLIKAEALNSTMYDDNFDPISKDGSGISAGGIVGFTLGNTVSGCTNTAECYVARGYVGGVVGYARNTEVSECRHKTAVVSGAASYARVGGIAGHLSNATVTACHVENATVDGLSQGNTGGISGAMSSEARVEKSTFNGTVNNSVKAGRSGAIVGYSLEGVTIKDCGAKGKIGNKTALADITTDNFDYNKKATVSGSYLLQ